VGQKTLKDIPDGEVNQVEEDFKSEGCEVVKKKQDDGKWTIIATCPDD